MSPSFEMYMFLTLLPSISYSVCLCTSRATRHHNGWIKVGFVGHIC